MSYKAHEQKMSACHRIEKMEVPTSNIPLLPLEPSLSTQGPMSSQPESTIHRTSREGFDADSIFTVSESPRSTLQPTSSANEPANSLVGNPLSTENMFKILWRSICRRLPEGWRFGAAVGAIFSLCAFIANILVFVILSTSRSKDAQGSNFATIREGHCSDIKQTQQGIHLIINAVSTLLLAASNYCMQCLSAPTRSEVDRSHEQGRYLDIGVPSLRNLRVIKRGKLACWLLLGVSSLPLHLIYNSTFFVSLANNSYDIYFASPGFENGTSFDHGLFPDTFLKYSYVKHSNGAVERYLERNLIVNHTRMGETYSYSWTESWTERYTKYLTQPSTVQQQVVQNLGIQKNGAGFERLENAECIDAYAKTPLSDRRTLILVSSTTPGDNHQISGIAYGYSFYTDTSTCNSTDGFALQWEIDRTVSCLMGSSLYTVTSYRSGLLPAPNPRKSNWFHWICSQFAEYDPKTEYIDYQPTTPALCGDGYWKTMRSNASHWSVYGFEIDYCISERLEHQCTLNMAGSLLIVVIVFNAIKVITICVTVFKAHDDPLITIGDAAASFIQNPNPVTQGLCLYTRKDFSSPRSEVYGRRDSGFEARAFKPEKKRRALAASERRWALAILLLAGGLSVILGFLGYAINILKNAHNRGSFKSIWDLGLGTMTSLTLITGWALPRAGDRAVISAVLMTNLPQTLSSMLYLVINSLFTSFSLAKEWSRYANRSAPLRVSKPRGKQRSTYFLQVPYRLAIPLMIFSTFLHWIMSQALFFTRVDAKDPTGKPSEFADTDGPTTCSYSPLGIIITAIVAFALMVFAVALGWCKLGSAMPLAGGCSLAISAACHSPEGTSELLPVMWGAIQDVREYTENGQQVGHCAFSNGPVEPPIEGHLYA